MLKIILATGSPYRREAFKFLGLDFKAVKSGVDESQARRDNPVKLVKKLSELKAKAVIGDYSDAVVIGMDSVGAFGDKILEKPKSKKKVLQRLKLLSGNNFSFYTGIFIINTNSEKSVLRVVETKILMRDISEKEINKYLDEDPNYNTYALGFDPLGHFSSTFIEKIEGSYNNLLRGIPLEIIVKMLPEVGYNS